jgi:cyclophilin family peptidyl-prolyl cis-trans isomerase
MKSMNLHIKPRCHSLKFSFILSVVALLFFTLVSCKGPKAAFEVTKETYEVGEIVHFINTSKNATQYSWLIDDDNIAEYIEKNPTHLFSQSGNYRVKLQAINGHKKTTFIRYVYVKSPDYCRLLLSTSQGDMVVELYDDTPQHRDNINQLAENGYYRDLLFHRVIEGFMAQTGDPNSRNALPGVRLGMGGPSYTVPAEIRDTLVHVKGVLAAARTPDDSNPKKESSGSQFYIVQGRTIGPNQLDDFELQKGIKYSDLVRKTYLDIGGAPQLDMEYTVFGKVVSGIDVLDRICGQRVDGSDRPLEDVKILDIKVIK